MLRGFAPSAVKAKPRNCGASQPLSPTFRASLVQAG